MNDEEIREMEQLYAEATQGPWRPYKREGYRHVIQPNGEGLCECFNDADMELIVKLFNGFPLLVKRLRAADKIIDDSAGERLHMAFRLNQQERELQFLASRLAQYCPNDDCKRPVQNCEVCWRERAVWAAQNNG